MLIRAENDNPEISAKSVYRASRAALFLPAAVVVGGYFTLLAWLTLTGQTGGALFRLSLIIIGVGGPVMLAHGFLRAYTIKLQPMAHALYVHRGFPRGEAIEIPYAMIRSLHVRRGLGGLISGAGTLIINLVTDQRVAVCDLATAEEAKQAIERILEREDSGVHTPPLSGNRPSATGS